MDSYMASNGSWFMVTWIVFKKTPLGSRPSIKPGDHGTPNSHNQSLYLVSEDFFMILRLLENMVFK